MCEAKMALVSSLLSVFVLLICSVHSTNVLQCKGTAKNTPVATEALVTNCTDSPCVFKRGDVVWINMTFTPDDDHTKLTNNVFATMMGMKHGYPGLNGADACAHLVAIEPDTGSGCPLKKGVKYAYSIQLPVKKNFPKVTVAMHFAIKDDATNREVACFETTVTIK